MGAIDKETAELIENSDLKSHDLPIATEHVFVNKKVADEQPMAVLKLDDEDAQQQLSLERKKQELEEKWLKLSAETVEPMEIEQQNFVEQTKELDESALECQTDETQFFQDEVVELARVLWTSTQEMQHYTKGCLWSPDGTCILVPVHLDGMHIYELPIDLYTAEAIDIERPLSNLKPAVHVAEGGTVYDVAWYPFMSSQDATTCCWLATRQHEPIHLWDAFDGSLRCSYRGYDAVDEVETAISVIFSLDAKNVIGGYKKSIKIFDTNIPGRDYSNLPVKQAVSCMVQNNCMNITAGTWKGFINHYDMRAPTAPMLVLGGHAAGVTWLRYAKTHAIDQESYMLFSGARKDNYILQWDLRNHLEPVRKFQRCVETNQRIYYDLSAQETWLCSGDTKGILRVWSLLDETVQLQLPLHNDCCNGVSLHPTLPIVATCSGQYHFTEDAVVEEAAQLQPETIVESKAQKIVDYENALLLLWRGKCTIKT